MKNNWKNLLKAIFLYYFLITIFTLIINLFYYYNIINNNSIKYFQMISLLIIHFLLGLFMGINSPEKGYLYGIRLSCIIISTNILTSIIVGNLSFSMIIYYLIVFFIVTLSSIIGINKRNDH